MSNQITALYIASLLICALILFLLFYSYSRVFGKFFPLLHNIPGGFISFLAVNEVLAVPFTLFHLRFTHFLLLFTIVNLVILFFGVKSSIKNKPRVEWGLLKSPYFILSVLTLFIALVMTQTYTYYSADDSFYLSLVEQNKQSDSLYSTDPSSGISNLRFPQAYRFQGWELIESALSKVFNLSTTELVRGLIPIIILPIVFFAFRKIFSEFLSRQEVYLALTLLFVMFIFGGYSEKSEGAFLMTRPWQGKTILVSLMIPILIFILYKTYKKLGEQKIRFFSTIFIINLAALALNPTSVFLCGSAIATFGLIMVLKSRSFRPAIGLIASLLPFIPIVLFTFFVAEPRGEARLALKPYIDYVITFVGSPGYFILWVLGLAAFVDFKIMRKATVLFYIYPLALFTTVLNPLFYPLVSEYITSTAYWRLFWLVPLTITLPVVGVEFIRLLKRKLTKKSYLLRNVTPVLGVILLLVLSGKYVYSREASVTEINLTRDKTPLGVAEVSNFLISQPDGMVLAAPHPAAFLHNFTTKHEVLAPRALNLRVYFDRESEGYKFRMSLFALMGKREVNAFPIERYHQVIRRYGVEYIVYELDNEYIRNYVDAYSPIELYRNEQYVVVKTNYDLD
jgi:hypothetical protein